MTFVTFDLHDINIINVEICGGIILFFARFTLSLHAKVKILKWR